MSRAYPSNVCHKSNTHTEVNIVELVKRLDTCVNTNEALSMTHVGGKTTLLLNNVVHVYHIFLVNPWESLLETYKKCPRFASYLRAQSELTRDRIATSWSIENANIKVKQDALTGLIDAFFRKVFYYCKPKLSIFDVCVPLPDCCIVPRAMREEYDSIMYRKHYLEYEQALYYKRKTALENSRKKTYGIVDGQLIIPCDTVLATMSKSEIDTLILETEEYQKALQLQELQLQ